MAIEVRGLSFSYGGEAVLRQLQFSVKPGELLAVLGANGAGKSTLFRCMLGLLGGYEGQVLLEGRNICAMTRQQIARAVAYIPQVALSTFDFTALDVALMGVTNQLAALASPKQEHVALAVAMLSEMGVVHLQNRNFGSLSGGERQLVLLARALVQQAKIMIMDEPTANLDYGNQQKVMIKVRDLAQRGYTVILSSHDPNQTLLYASRVLALRQGGIYADGAPGTVLTSEVLSTLYATPVQRRRLDGEHPVYVCVPGGEAP